MLESFLGLGIGLILVAIVHDIVMDYQSQCRRCGGRRDQLPGYGYFCDYCDWRRGSNGT